MKKIYGYIVILLMIFLCFFNATKAESTEPKQIQVYLTCDYQDVQGKNGHTFPSTIERFPKEIKWGTFDITVTDSKGNVYKVPTQNAGYQAIYLDKTFPVGEELIVKINPKDIPEGYHLSGEYNRKLKKFEYFERHCTVASGEPYETKYDIRIGLGKTDLVLDLNGGNVNGNTDRITERINVNNTINFPKPTKENLEYIGKWYTETEKGRYTFDEKTLFSDYSHEWQKYNLESFDPRYDGKFVLRAYYVANINFDTRGGSEVQGGKLYEGKKVPVPEKNPTKDGFTFVRWNDVNNNEFNFDTPITAHTTIYASWTDIPTVDPIKEGDNSVKVGVPVEADKVVITLSDSTKVIVEKGKDNSWTIPGGNTVVVEKGKLVIPVDGKKVNKGSSITVNTEKDNIPSDKINITVDGGQTIQKKTSAPKTGDTSNIGFAFSLLVLSLTTILFIKNRKYNK